MARGRMLNSKISRNKAVAELIEETSCAGGLLYTWIIAHLDVEGRISGDPDVLKGLVAPRVSEITPGLVEVVLEAAHRLGLVVWYEIDGDRWLSFPRFAENQTGIRKDRERPSEIPAPELLRSNAGVAPELLRPNITEQKGTKGKRTEHNIPRAPRSDVETVVSHYRQVHSGRGKHLKPGHKDWRRIEERLLEGFTVADLCAAIDGNSQDEWHQGTPAGHSIEYVFRNATKVEGFMTLAREGPKLTGWMAGSQELLNAIRKDQLGANDRDPNTFEGLLPKPQDG